MRSPYRLVLVHALSGICLISCASGGKSDASSAAPKAESNVSSAGSVSSDSKVSEKAAAGKAGAVAAVGGANVAGSRSIDASVQDDDAGPGRAGAAGSEVRGAAGVSGTAAAVSGSGGASESSGAAAAGMGGVPAQRADAGVPGATVTLTGTVIEVHPDGNFTPHGDAEVCVLDSMPPVCATADASGMLVIKLPANAHTGLTMNLPSLFPMLTPITTAATDINLSGRGQWSNYGASVALTEETRKAAVPMLGTTLEPDKGQADMIVYGLGSGTVTLEGAPAELKWFASGGRFTVTDGPAPFGSALHGFTNIEPGMRTFRAEMNGKPCEWDPMIWPGTEPGTITVPIRAGWWTRLMEVRCN